MRINVLFSMMTLAFCILLLGALPMGCKNADNQKTDQTEAEQQITTTVPDEAAPGPEATVEAPEAAAPEETEEQNPATTQTAAPAPPAPPKPATAAKSPAKTTETKKQETVQAPKTTVKPEPEKAKETVTAPTTTKPSPPPPPPATTAPKPAPAPPPVVEEAKKTETEPAPKPTPPQTTPQSSDWPVPASYKNKANPVQASKESIAIGKDLWSKHCKSCHGKDGLGDGPKAAQLDGHPGDFSTKGFQSQTDGALFYKTWEGKGDMPAYKRKIPDEEDIWNLVNFMRTMKN